MKALVYTGAMQLVFRDEPDPVPATGESLVRIEASGICGSDMHAYHGLDQRRVAPSILGHELSGTVISGELTGQRVAINPLVSCQNCDDCLAGHPNLCAQRDLIGLGMAGGFAELVSVASCSLIPLNNATDIQSAALMEPTAVTIHALMLAQRSLLRPLSECRCLVIGGGAIGLLTALVLRHKGARELVIAETNPLRRTTLEQLNCGAVYDPQTTNTYPDNYFELVVDAVGSGQTRTEASRLARSGGVISHIGLQNNEAGLDTRRLTLQEITFIGNYTYSPIDLRAALDMIGRGTLGALDWIESRPLSDGAAAFNAIHTGETASPKIILNPTLM